jgi:hypothetical protein
VLIGSEGNDTMAGGAGADMYMFFTGSGTDQVTGFVFGEGDRLSLQGQSYTLGSSADGDVLLKLSGGGTVELNGTRRRGSSRAFWCRHNAARSPDAQRTRTIQHGHQRCERDAARSGRRAARCMAGACSGANRTKCQQLNT